VSDIGSSGFHERSLPPWKRAVLATLSMHAFRGLSEEEQLRRLDVSAGLSCNGAQVGLFLRIANDQGRLGVADEILGLCRRIGGVERQIDRAGAKGCKI